MLCPLLVKKKEGKSVMHLIGNMVNMGVMTCMLRDMCTSNREKDTHDPGCMHEECMTAHE